MKKYLLLPLLPLLSFALVLAGCSNGTNPTPTPTPSPSPTPVVATPISPTVLALIQTSSTVATGAVLDFAVTQTSTRTALANEIYASASAIYSLTGGTVPTPSQLNSTLGAWGVNGGAQYTQYASALSTLYTVYYQKYVGGSITATDISSVLNSIAAGAEQATQSYVTVTPAVAALPASALAGLHRK